jgi:ATP-dependent Lon protease
MPKKDSSMKNQPKNEVVTRSKKLNGQHPPPNPSDTSDDEEFSQTEYKQLLSKLFPSKYMTEKLKTDVKNIQPNQNNSSVNKLTKNKSSDNSMDTETTKFNIIFSINEDKDDDDESYEEFDSDDEEYETEDEDEDVSSSDDDDSSDEDEETDDDSEEETTDNSSKKKNKCDKNKDAESSCNNINVLYELLGKMKKMKESGISETTVSNENIIEQLNIIKTKCNNKLIQTCIQECKKELIRDNKRQTRKLEKHKEKNQRIFRKIIKNKSMLNEVQYFSKLDISEQKNVIKKIRDINLCDKCDKPFRLSLIESDIPSTYKAVAMKKISILQTMDQSSGEYYKIKNWVDTFMKIPFGKINKLPIHLTDGVEKCHSFMADAQRTLDTAVYGLNDAKMQIMQILGQLITNPSSIGTAVAIHGPPGSGKTSLVKEGISKILNRPFAFIALGGATDSSFLEGHSYTYEGSLWGKIVQILIESKSMNPVIYFDELDKISNTSKGEEIVNILTHLTDTTQNTMFHDKYFSDIDFDLSKCIFIFSYNDESKVNPILKDRMYRIKTKGYDLKQKTIIGNQYLLPKIQSQVAFENGQVIIQDDALHYIIENFCANEEGVRNLKRCIEIIYTKLNLFRLMKPDENLFETEFSLKVSFPFLVTKNIVDKLIKKEDGNFNYRNMYI